MEVYILFHWEVLKYRFDRVSANYKTERRVGNLAELTINKDRFQESEGKAVRSRAKFEQL